MPEPQLFHTHFWDLCVLLWPLTWAPEHLTSHLLIEDPYFLLQLVDNVSLALSFLSQ